MPFNGLLLFTQTGETLTVVSLLVGPSWFVWGIFSLLSIFKDIVLEGFDDSLGLAKLLSGGTEPAEPAAGDASS